MRADVHYFKSPDKPMGALVMCSMVKQIGPSSWTRIQEQVVNVFTEEVAPGFDLLCTILVLCVSHATARDGSLRRPHRVHADLA
jgi:hypothetical protein